MLNRISKKFGITKTEIKIILFAFSVLITGFISKNFFVHSEENQFKVFDYSEEEEEFNNLKSDSNLNNSFNRKPLKQNYKDEVLILSETNFEHFSKKIFPKEKSINLNTATKSDLVNLPGIGDKTADGILTLRNRLKKFTNVNQLLDVKGIGESKLNNIKKYIYIN